MTEELLEVVNVLGEPTGDIYEKSYIHAQGLRHAGAHGFVTDGRGNLLCQLRGPRCGMMRNQWDPVGVAGHISAWTLQESRPSTLVRSIQTLAAEFSEELGHQLPFDLFLDPSRAVFMGITHTNMPVEDGWQHVTVDFNWMLLLPDINPTSCPLEDGKVLRVEWRSVDEVLRGGTGMYDHPYVVRQPDNKRLLSVACEVAHMLAM